MVIQEAKRAYTYLQLYGYNVDGVIVNRIMPEKGGGALFKKYLESQKKHLADIEDSFAPLPIFKVNHQGEEVFGLELLEKIGKTIYGDLDPTKVFHSENPFEVVEEKNSYEIRIKLPLLEEDHFTLKKYGDELVIDIGNRRKNIFLPKFANFLELEEYAYHEPWLSVWLKK